MGNISSVIYQLMARIEVLEEKLDQANNRIQAIENLMQGKDIYGDKI